MKLTALLLEDRAEHLADTLNTQLVARYKQDAHQETDARSVLNQLMKADPTRDSKFIHWIAAQYAKGGFSIKDVSDVKHDLAEFERVKSKLDIKSVEGFQSVKHLSQAVAPYNHEDVEGGSGNDNRARMFAEADVIFKSDEFSLVSPRTEAACKYFGRGTSWDLAKDGGDFRSAHETSPIYILTARSGEKYMMSFAAPDKNKGPDDEDFGPMLKNAQGNDVMFKELKDHFRNIVNILSEKTTFKAWTNASDSNVAIWYAENVMGGRWPEGEKTIMNDPKNAVDYAVNVIRGRWTEAEPAIMRDPLSAIEYCLQILDTRWPAAEPTIMKRSDTALKYAQEVIKGRWEEAEKIIKAHPHDAEIYQKEILKGSEWPDDIDTSRHTGEKPKEAKAQ